jgi:hypothetical protein
VTTPWARLRHWNERIDATGDVRALSVLRILLGPIVLLHLEDTFRRAADGVIYSDRFSLPYADWYPEAGRSLYLTMLVGAGVAAVAMSIGLATRWRRRTRRGSWPTTSSCPRRTSPTTGRSC